MPMWQHRSIRACIVISTSNNTKQTPVPAGGRFPRCSNGNTIQRDIRADQLDEGRSGSFRARLPGLGVAFAKSSLSMTSCLPVVWSRPHVAAFFAMPPCCCMAWGMAGDSRMDTSCSMVRRRVAANSDRGAYFERCWLAENSTTHHDRGSIV